MAPKKDKSPGSDKDGKAKEPDSHWYRFQKGRKKTGGRVKGTKNKYTADVAKALEAVYEKIGGDEAMAEFAKDNPEGFFKLWSKMLPTRIDANITMPKQLLEALQEGRKRASNKSKK